MAGDRPLVFVYGTLLFAEVTDALGIRQAADESVPALLPDFRRQTVRLSASGNFPAIVPAAEQSVAGRVLSLLGPDDLRVMDEFEGLDEGYYSRQTVRVTTSAGRTLEAFAYVCGARLRPFLAGSWDPVKFRAHDLSDYVGRIVKSRQA